MIEALPMRPEIGKPPPSAFGDRDQVWLNAVILNGEHFAGLGKARLYFVGDKQDAVAVTDFPERTHNRHGRLIEPAFALHGLNYDSGRLVWRTVSAKDVVQRILFANAMVWNSERAMEDAGAERPKACLIGRDLAGHGHRQQRAAMEPPVKVMPPGRPV